MVLMFTSITNGAAFGFIDAIDPIGTMNDKVYERMDKVYTEMEKFQPYIDPEITLVSDIALYASNECSIDERDNGKDLYTKTFSISLFIIFPNWKQPTFQTIARLINYDTYQNQLCSYQK